MDLTKVAIVDDHKLFGRSLEVLIKTFTEYTVILCCNDGSDLIQKISNKFKPDIVLLDQNMPNMDGYETVLHLKENFPEIKIIILSMNHDEDTVVKMVLKGIDGYLLKDAELNEFKNALDTVRKDGNYFPSYITNYLIKDARKSRMAKNDEKINLKFYEIEFLKLASSELTYKEIANLMCISNRTVDGYREQLFKKLGVKSRIGLVLYAMNNNLI
ncbi:response regulator transcription factor [Mucilaginibacter sp. KACC 22773]|uniref:response regulator transcription factor n=1 Tax=Mucilaginibacter sp. KACC 22773 TaxID=3025671 RepID=UPI002365D2A3|nr:response regulator transcription factor [Mucilaginibacter sp. KACC 22773]WDF79343.1 response regulator transcription factor [Mucilaginibacter sp. KACC 22773]